MNYIYKTLLVLLITINALSAQEVKSDFNTVCEYNTNGIGKSEGLKIKLSLPCDWDQEEGARPHVVKKFSFDLKNGTSLGCIISVKNSPTILSNAELRNYFTEKNIKEAMPNDGTFISAKKIKADGLDCAELSYIYKNNSAVGDVYMYILQYSLFYKNKLIIISFATGGLNFEQVKELINCYQMSFKGIMNSFVLLNQWES